MGYISSGFALLKLFIEVFCDVFFEAFRSRFHTFVARRGGPTLGFASVES